MLNIINITNFTEFTVPNTNYILSDIEIITKYCNFIFSNIKYMLLMIILTYLIIELLYFFGFKKLNNILSKAYYDVLIIPYGYILFYILTEMNILKEHYINLIKYIFLLIICIIILHLYISGKLKKIIDKIKDKNFGGEK